VTVFVIVGGAFILKCDKLGMVIEIELFESANSKKFLNGDKDK
jgi:hypothetical protein